MEEQQILINRAAKAAASEVIRSLSSDGVIASIEPRYLTAKSLCEYLSVSMTTIRSLERSGRISAYKVDGCNKLYDRKEIDLLVSQCKIPV